ncbi:MAG: Crp/Fnr family transcriptional regulator [Bacteroidales bacterium]|nr:Crp/Fnr family transcriptional regulator [Bacteroidales bacterium]
MKTSNDIINCRSCIYRNLLYDKLNDKEYGQVNSARTEYIYQRGELIKQEGDKIKSFLYLRVGLVKLFKTDHFGKDHILSINKPGDFISLLSIFSNSTYKYSISALEETHVCEVALPVLKNLVASNGAFALKVLNRMSHISDTIIENSFRINQKQVKGRIAHILLFLADKIYHGHTFRMPITRREVGELISMTTENTIRTLSEFKKDGIISMDGKTISILDYGRLVKVSKSG